MCALPLRRVAVLILFSVTLTVTLGFGLPALLNYFAMLCGLPEANVAECIVGVYLFFVLYVAMPPIPQGTSTIHFFFRWQPECQ
uniref:Uncharacterized protein n=1 Tax=Anguilla anguilla TaxID=7936 RepID=A0A0E9VNI6_ANGAN